MVVEQRGALLTDAKVVHLRPERASTGRARAGHAPSTAKAAAWHMPDDTTKPSAHTSTLPPPTLPPPTMALLWPT